MNEKTSTLTRQREIFKNETLERTLNCRFDSIDSTSAKRENKVVLSVLSSYPPSTL